MNMWTGSLHERLYKTSARGVEGQEREEELDPISAGSDLARRPTRWGRRLKHGAALPCFIGRVYMTGRKAGPAFLCLGLKAEG